MVKFTLSALLFATAVAGAQTVTLGATSSSTNGNTTTITLPVTVAVPPATTTAPAALHSFRVELGDGTGSPSGQTLSTSFTTIAFNHVLTDTASGWNATANTYTVPVTGTYIIVSMIRFIDSLPAGVSYGQGVNTSNVDSPSFFWSATAGKRNGSVNVRTVQLSAGQVLDLFAYGDSSSALPVASASLSIQQLQ